MAAAIRLIYYLGIRRKDINDHFIFAYFHRGVNALE